MIVAFLLFYCYSVGAWKYLKKCLNNSVFGKPCQILHAEDSETWDFDFPVVESTCYIDEDVGIRFVPPVYVQRYTTVAEILRNTGSVLSIKKVVDFGCSEMAFFTFLKNMEEVEEVLCIDIDEGQLERSCNRTRPFTSDYLRRRKNPFKVQVLRGSVSDADESLKGTNAVVAIELIEHLYPETLEDLPYVIFGIIQPEIAIFTTPNSDFNVLFTNCTGFRHDDHKFEWSREQFIDWGNNLTVRYPDYHAVFNGIGPGPEGTEEFGCCSQIAVFCRKSPERMHKPNEFVNCYKLISEYDHPSNEETATVEEIIRYDAESFIRYALQSEDYVTESRIEIPLSVVMGHVPSTCLNQDMLQDILTENGWTIEAIQSGIMAVILPLYGLSSDSSSEPSDLQEEVVWLNDDVSFEEIWDNDNANDTTAVKNQSDPTWHEESTEDSSTTVKVACNGSGDDPTNGVGYHLDQTVSGLDSVKREGDEEIKEAPLCKDWIKSDLRTDIKDPFGEGKSFSIRDVSENGDNSSHLSKCRSFDHILREVNKNKNFRYSLCYDAEKSACDSVGAKSVVFSTEKGSSEDILSGASCIDGVLLRLEDSCSQSKAGDSGYPNSSEQDMEMDLTPEQVDEIVTESESSFEDGDDDESVHGEGNRGVAPALPMQWVDNMENGDVANNNRDWEGNNMEGEAQIGEPLQFENVIAQQDFAMPLLDAVPQDLDSEDENKYLSASEFLNTSDDTIVAFEDSCMEPLNSSLSSENETQYFESSINSSEGFFDKQIQEANMFTRGAAQIYSVDEARLTCQEGSPSKYQQSFPSNNHESPNNAQPTSSSNSQSSPPSPSNNPCSSSFNNSCSSNNPQSTPSQNPCSSPSDNPQSSPSNPQSSHANGPCTSPNNPPHPPSNNPRHSPSNNPQSSPSNISRSSYISHSSQNNGEQYSSSEAQSLESNGAVPSVLPPSGSSTSFGGRSRSLSMLDSYSVTSIDLRESDISLNTIYVNPSNMVDYDIEEVDANAEFPQWLLNMLFEETGAGDVGSEDVLEEVPELDENLDEEIEMIVEGDMKGAGEPNTS